jgi:hypothetical protein
MPKGRITPAKAKSNVDKRTLAKMEAFTAFHAE